MKSKDTNTWKPYVEYSYGVWWPKVSRKFGPIRITKDVHYTRSSGAIGFNSFLGSCSIDRAEAEDIARRGADVKNGRNKPYGKPGMQEVEYV
jgi:hypothetical protein